MKLVPLVIIFSYFVFVSLFLSYDIDGLLHSALADDAFYYFVLARNHAENNVIEFNEGVPTNGFHPLYFMFCSMFFAIFSQFGVNAPIYVILLFLALVHLATGLLLSATLRNRYGEDCGNIALFLWLLNPQIVYTVFMGLETTLQVFIVAVIIAFTSDRIVPSWDNTILYGFLFGLLFLARQDGAVFIAGALVVMYFNRFYTDKEILVMCGIALVLVSPYLYTSYSTTGHLMPHSGKAIRHMNRFADDMLTKNSSLNRLNEVVAINVISDATIGILYLHVIYFIRFFWVGFSSIWDAPFIAIIAFAPMLYVTLKDRKFVSEFILRFDVLLIGTFAVLAFYFGTSLGLREWYVLLPYFTMTVIWAAFINRAATLSGRGALLPMMLVFGLLFAHGMSVKFYEGNFPQERLKKLTAEYVDGNVPVDAVVGSWNTGVIQYYTPNHDVINLDGVINVHAYEANANFKLKEFIDDENITFIADDTKHAQKMLDRMKMNYTKVHAISMSHWTNRWGNLTEHYGVFKIG